MNHFQFEKLDLEGAYLINSFFSEDNRGSFVKSFEKEIFTQNKILFECSEDFISHSIKNVIRGMHFQITNPQAKLVGVISGKVFDVIIDLRKESATFGQWRGYYLSSENRTSLYIPQGFAHGFIALSDNSIVSYKCEGAYHSQSDSGIKFDDTDIGIEWPISDLHLGVISERDKNLMSFKEFISQFGGF